jgi:hypothetical protein
MVSFSYDRSPSPLVFSKWSFPEMEVDCQGAIMSETLVGLEYGPLASFLSPQLSQ